MRHLLDHFARAVARHPDRVAIIDGLGQETRFRDLDERIKALSSRWARQGIGRGDRVLIALGLSADLYASLAALWTLGATVVLPEPALGLRGLRHAARVTSPRAYCASGWFLALRFLPALIRLPLLRPGRGTGPPPDPAVEPEDIALISFTSGTTGAPKGIPRSHAFLIAQYAAVAPLLASDNEERDLVTFPVFTLVNLAEGRTSVLPNWPMRRLARLAPGRLGRWLREQRITRALVPPSLCEKLLQTEVPGSLRTIFTGGGPAFPDLIEALGAKTGARIVSVYGSTEAEPIAHLDACDVTQDDRAAMGAGHGLLVGQPVPEIAVRIDAGEVLVSGPHVNETYLDPARNAETKVIENGVTWHRTGDAGAIDATGRIWLLGRTGGTVETPLGPVHPFAIEVAARHWPGVSQSALMMRDRTPALAVEGDARHLPQWQEAAGAFGVGEVVAVRRIPMDRRHASKVDRARLARMIGA